METPPAPNPPSSAQPELPARRVTMRDIARALGVSHVTVSYALRGLPRVSEDMRKKICDEAERMGYRPDPLLQALSTYRRTSKTSTIQAALGWLSCWEQPDEMFERKEFHAYWSGVKQTAEAHGYRLERFTPSPDMSLKRIQQIMRARNILGVFIPPPQSSFKMKLSDLDWSDFVLVKFGHSFGDLRVHLVTSAHVHNAMLAFNRIRERGYQRIGFVTSAYSMTRTQFASGFLRAQYDVPRKEHVPILALSEDEVRSECPEALRKWLDKERPDAVLSNLREVPAMLRTLGRRIPDDIGVAALSVHDGNADAGIDQNPFEIGRAACEMIIAQIIHGGGGVQSFPRELLVEGAWIDGSMLRDLRTAGTASSTK